MNDNKATKFPRTGKILIGLFCIGFILLVLRRPILTTIASALVRPDGVPISADIMAIGGDGASKEMLAWLQEHEDAKLLLVRTPDPRVVQIGASVSDAQRRLAISKTSGVPEDRIEILIGKTMRAQRPVQAMQTWLSQHPERRIHVLCDQFQSRGLRRAVNRTLRPEHAARITLAALIDRRHAVDDWWTTRLGVRAVFDAYLDLTRSLLGWGSPEPPRYLTPDQYEQAFLNSLGPSFSLQPGRE